MELLKKIYFSIMYVIACIRGGKGADWFSLVLTEEEYSSVCNWVVITNKRSGFSPLSIIKVSDDKVVALCHGTPEGNVLIGEEVMSPEQLLKGLIDDKCIGPDIKLVMTLSCFGRNQKPAKVNGVKIRSMHNTGSEIYIVPVEQDGKKYMNFNINPDTVGAILRGE